MSASSGEPAPPSLYQYYTAGGIRSGLSTDQPWFTLNHKKITIYSGALHYFRVPRAYWRDRLRKLRAAGLNCVETYVPWNLHNPEKDVFDFGDGRRDFSDFLNLEEFLRIAQEEDLLVIARPGPYICAEWDFGGLPSWILQEDVRLRTSDPRFVELVRRYFGVLIPKVAAMQFCKGGPVIAVQIENEYGNTKVGDQPIDTEYLTILKQLLEENGIVELLFTSDTPSNGFSGTLPGVLATANFQEEPVLELGLLKDHQPGKPLMVMEYWTGWFDHWSEKHHTRTAEAFGQVLEGILDYGASVNMYMFHGGTNWGFLNGANIKDLSTDNSAYQPDTTSYDYDAPLSESGDYTEKYYKTKEIIGKYNEIVTKLPEMPEVIKPIQYPSIPVEGMLTVDDLIAQSSRKITSSNLPSMEAVGQSYGYIVYRKTNIGIAPRSVLKIEGHVCDTVLVLINGELKSKILENQEDLNGFGYWRLKNSTLDLGPNSYENATLDLVVENWGRCNYGKLYQFEQRKGLWQGNVYIDDTPLEEWEIIPMDFDQKWTNSLDSWRKGTVPGPALYKAVVNLDEPSRDTYLDMRGWVKGFVIVNNFVLGRYFKLGPQQTMYLPGAFLRKGANMIYIFEHFRPNGRVNFACEPTFQTLS